MHTSEVGDWSAVQFETMLDRTQTARLAIIHGDIPIEGETDLEFGIAKRDLDTMQTVIEAITQCRRSHFSWDDSVDPRTAQRSRVNNLSFS